MYLPYLCLHVYRSLHCIVHTYGCQNPRSSIHLYAVKSVHHPRRNDEMRPLHCGLWQQYDNDTQVGRDSLGSNNPLG